LDTPAFIEKQISNIHAIYRTTIADLTETEWRARLAPNQNRLGYIAWHIPRTQDSMVQLWIRGVPEVWHGPRWTEWHALRPLGLGIGISLAEADMIPEQIDREATLAYADAVHDEIVAWLRSTDAAALDPLIDVTARLAPFPEYQTAGFLSEMASLMEQPVWGRIMRPCIGHVHRHLGELETSKALLRLAA
jgi:hypothetical protein